MGIFDGLLLVSDLDGTLLNSQSKIGDKTHEKLKYFMENGGRFSVATGRTAGSMSLNLPDILTNAPSVFHSGAIIFDLNTKREIEHYTLDESVYSLAEAALLNIPFSAIEVLCKNDVYVINANNATKWHLETEDFFPNYVENLSDIPRPWTRISFWNDEDKLDHAAEYVRNYCKDLPYKMFKVHSRSYEAINEKASKGYAVERLKKLLPNVKTVITAGDNENDISMLERADISFAPINATDEVKVKVTEVLDVNCESDFIAHVIEKIEKRYLKE